MNKYYLYLDESETHKNGNNRVFCIAGIIINEEDVEKLDTLLNNLKNEIWVNTVYKNNANEIILHEKDVRFANNRSNRSSLNKVSKEFHIFKQNDNTRNLYEGISNIFNEVNLKVIGASVDLDKLDMYFDENMQSDKYLVCMQIILENFCHFLESNDGRGVVMYESREEHNDKIVRMKFNQIKACGSMFINPYAMQKRLIDIEFPCKNDNISGLQIADFIPNTFARKHAKFEQHKFNLYKCLRLSRYCGNINKYDRFGIKFIPE